MPPIAAMLNWTDSLKMRIEEPLEKFEKNKRIVEKAPQLLFSSGYLMFEIGYDQAKPVLELMVRDGYRDLKTIKDLTGKDRVIVAHKW